MSIRNRFQSIVFATLCGLALTANAQVQLSLASGDAKTGSTYGIMSQELLKECPAARQTATTNGSLQSLQLLMDNKVNMAIVQGDVLTWKSKQADASNIKVLMPLNNEEVHVVVRNAEYKEGGFLGFGANKFIVKDVSNQKGRKVGAVGGSAISANVISSTGNFGWQVIEYKKNDELLKALAASDVDAAVIVAGAPAPVIEALPPQYRFAGFPQPLIDAVSKHYVAKQISYPNLGAGGNVMSIATPAYLVTQAYEGRKMIEALTQFRDCAYGALADIRETTGTHRKWKEVPKTIMAGQAASKWPLFNVGQ